MSAAPPPRHADRILSTTTNSSVKIKKARKGFTSYLSERSQVIVGFLVFLTAISPAIFFSAVLGAPYYTVTPHSCNNALLLNQSEWGVNANPIPPQTFYFNEKGVTDLTSWHDWLYNGEWTIYINLGVCPTSKGSSRADTAAYKSYCLPFDDASTPTVWQQIDIQNQRYDIYSDFNQGAKNYRQAYRLAIAGCIFAWILITYSLIHAYYTDEHIEHEFFEDTNPQRPPPSTVYDKEEADSSGVQLQDLSAEEGGGDGEVIPAPNAPQPTYDNDDDGDGDVTYTKAVVFEFLIFVFLFGMSTSVLKLIVESELSYDATQWQGWFPTCQVKIESGASVGLLYYQSITMGIYVCLLGLSEMYYGYEYLIQCNHHLMTHPDDRDHIESLVDENGNPLVSTAPKRAWTGPVVSSRLHILKVRAIKKLIHPIIELIYGSDHEHVRKLKEHSARASFIRRKLKEKVEAEQSGLAAGTSSGTENPTLTQDNLELATGSRASVQDRMNASRTSSGLAPTSPKGLTPIRPI